MIYGVVPPALLANRSSLRIHSFVDGYIGNPCLSVNESMNFFLVSSMKRAKNKKGIFLRRKDRGHCCGWHHGGENVLTATIQAFGQYKTEQFASQLPMLCFAYLLLLLKSETCRILKRSGAEFQIHFMQDCLSFTYKTLHLPSNIGGNQDYVAWC